MAQHWKYDAALPGGMRHSVQVQTDNPRADFNLLVLGPHGALLDADRGPEAGALCTFDLDEATNVTFIVELASGSGNFSVQVASQPLPRSGRRSRTLTGARMRNQRQRSRDRTARTRERTRARRTRRQSNRPSIADLSRRTAAPPPAADRPRSTRSPGSLDVAGSAVTATEAAGIVEAHNRWRQRYGVPPLAWSSELARYAQQWADELGRTGMQMRHRSPNDYGENLYWCSGRAATPDAVVDAWGSEDELYDYDANNWWPDAGHFSQLVWRTTTHVGAGVVRRRGTEIWVCNYDPRGNWTGQRPY